MIVATLLALVASTLAIPLQREQAPAGVPSYVLTYTPVVYLYSSDSYRPADIGAQLVNAQPELNYTLINNTANPLTLDNLDSLNDLGSTDVYLTSKDNVEADPTWLFGIEPDSNGKTNGAVSCAVIVNDHGGGLVDAFYMYFYAFDYGGNYFGINLGDHVGDWEYNMVRFQDGKPQAIWYSQHSNGEAFTYDAVLKYQNGPRPIAFSANGTHANYATSGTHDHTIPDINLPEGLLEDYADMGPLWDPILSAYYYTYDANTQKFSAYDNITPVNWLYYVGRWGDDQYPDSDPRQRSILRIDGLYKYVSGPTGPGNKDLDRTDVCPDNGIACIIRPILTP